MKNIIMSVQIFCYGSNLLPAHIENRVGPVKRVGIGYLSEHKLMFDKVSRDGSAKADAFFTGKEKDKVWGVVYEISEDGKTRLDEYEGLGKSYDEKKVKIHREQGKPIDAGVYVAQPGHVAMAAQLFPYDWYKQQILMGAIQHGLPAPYVRMLANYPSRNDRDSIRAKRNWDEICTYLTDRLKPAE
jgi:gamma-glutamylcyclotransferase